MDDAAITNMLKMTRTAELLATALGQAEWGDASDLAAMGAQLVAAAKLVH